MFKTPTMADAMTKAILVEDKVSNCKGILICCIERNHILEDTLKRKIIPRKGRSDNLHPVKVLFRKTDVVCTMFTFPPYYLAL